MTAGGGQGANLRTMPARLGRADALALDLKAKGMAAAIAWREARRCREPVADPFSPVGTRECRALAWQPCAHRPEGLV